MKLLIVDDEERTRELLRKYIPWDVLGIDEVQTARNGQVALELASEWGPDIVLCDVRMPKMNGIEFAQRLRETDAACTFIFLSGFSDKEYLKSAIHLKALNYIEKPVNLEEVRSAVQLAVQVKLDERKKQSEDRRLQAGVDRSLPFLRQEMVRKLIANPTSSHVRPALENEATFLLPLKGPYTVVAAPLYWDSVELPEDPTSIQEGILYSLSTHSRIGKHRLISGFDSRNWLVLILPGAYGSTYRQQREIIEELYVDLRKTAGEFIDLRVGVGEPVATLEEIPYSYRTAVNMSIVQYYGDGCKPLFHSEVTVGHSPMETKWEEIRSFRDVLRKGDIEEAKRTIHLLTERARKHCDLDILKLKDNFFQFLLVILEVAVQQGITEQSEDAERKYIWKEVDRNPSLDRLEAYVLSFLQPFSERTHGEEQGSVKIREIVRYIHAHFQDKGFTIQAIANHVNLSETYLCSYFKKQRGETIKEFITLTRTEKAKELLRDRNMKLFEVAVRVGFNDANYFTTFFKRYVGCTPSEYRERMPR
ncbi:response regulator [Paenibacillus sp. CF384]|uniref:response regulator n=1 Tax=Paenibacillus sp. CF384 TaxID=1884382 RepID=UPI000898BF96|nr:response regulator [Paenibacillus sp. CF384]SDW14842.1 two-component system, response regulator YesN [Paenibacillus sp. CF384]